MIQSKITYHQQVTYCGKTRCRRCREGIGHGPYWYAYQTVNGRTTRKYIGKHLPPDVQTSELSPVTSLVQAEAESVPMPYSVPISTSSAVPPVVRSPDASSTPILSAITDRTILRIKTCGQFSLEQHVAARSRYRGLQSSSEWSNVSDTNWQQRPVKDLLGYLICAPERKGQMATMAGTLWPELSGEEANARLLQALKILRKVLGLQAVKRGQEDNRAQKDTSETIWIEDGWLRLAGQDRIWIDVDEFETVARQLEHEQQNLSSPAYEQMLRHATRLGRGDFLAELHSSPWVQVRAREVRLLWSALSLRLAAYYMAGEQYGNAITTFNALLLADPLDEQATQQAMTAFYQQQRRREAIDIYRTFAARLQNEYQAIPSAETQAIYEAIRTGAPLAVPAAPPHITEGKSDKRFSGKRSVIQGPRSISPVIEQIGRANQSVLVGREQELQVIRAMLRDVRNAARLQTVGSRHVSGIPLDTQRQPQFLLLNGAPGIGKTRLAEEIGREALHDGWTVTWSRQYEQESGIPYRIWTDTLHKLLTLESNSDVLSHLSSAAIQSLSTLPGLIDVLPLDTLTKAPPPQIFSPENAQFRLYSVICDLLKEISLRTPLLLVLDDIQWSDASSHQLLGHLARQLTGYPVVLFSTCRDTDKAKDSNRHLRQLILEMKREHTINELDVAPLSTEQIEQLVTSLSALSEETVKSIQDRAAGNPFFAEEFARSLSPTLPPTIADALDYRMKSLTPECANILKRAAILGGSFDFSVICAMETAQSGSDSDYVLSLLEEAQDADVVMEEASGARIVYHFWHPLVASHLYDKVSAARRRRWHKEAADAILQLSRGREEVVAAQVVLHLDKAGDDPLVVAHYAELAGDNAFALPAYAEAASYYQLAVTRLEQSHAVDEQAHLHDLLERLGECSKNSGSYEKATDIYTRLLHLRQQTARHGDPRFEAQVQALLWDETCWTWRYRGDIQRAWQCCQQGEHILRTAQIGDGPACARLYYTRSNLYLSEGQYDRALEYARGSLTLLSSPGLRTDSESLLDRKVGKTLIQRTLDGDPVNLCRLHRHLGVIAVAVGQLQQALEHQVTALESFEQYNESRQVGNILSNIGFIQIKMGQYQQAQQSLQRALDLAERMGDGPLRSLVISNFGELYAATGDLDAAQKEYTRALRLSGLFGDREYMSRWHAGLACIMLEQGELVEAATHVGQALIIARKMKNQPCLGQALVVLANLRIEQAKAFPPASEKRALLLARAQRNVQHALSLKVEAETHRKGELASASIALEQGDAAVAHTLCTGLVADARDYGQIVASARRLLARMPDVL